MRTLLVPQSKRLRMSTATRLKKFININDGMCSVTLLAAQKMKIMSILL